MAASRGSAPRGPTRPPTRCAGGFFADTLETIDKACLRPRFDGYIPAYEHMALLVHRWLKHGGDERRSLRTPTTNLPAPAKRRQASPKRND